MSLEPVVSDQRAGVPITDMVISETFHRLKRTTLLFSSTLFVLSFAIPEATDGAGAVMETVHMTVADIDLSLAVARWFLWLAAAYYFIGFLLESRVCIRLNANILRRSNVRQYEDVIRSVAEQLKHRADFIEAESISKLENVFEQSQRLEHALIKIEEGPDSLVAMMGPADREGDYMFYRHADASQIKEREAVIVQRAIRQISDEGTKATEAVRLALELAVPTLKQIAAEARAAGSNAAKAHRDLTKLNDLISTERKWSFWLWEIGGACIAFIAATVSLPVARYWASQAITSIF